MTLNRYLKLVQISAAYDLIVTGAFALPLIASFTVVQLQQLHRVLGLSGDFPAFSPMHMLFVQLLGSLVVVWSMLRILKPQALFGLCDATGRALFSLHMATALFLSNGSELIWLFLIPEAAFGVAQFAGYWLLNQHQSGNTLQPQS